MKNIKLYLLVFAVAVMSTSCSEDNDHSGSGTLKLSGTVMAPNNLFPISRAHIKVSKDGNVVAEQTADALGQFTVDHLPSGNLAVELSKGKFKRQITIDLEADYELQPLERNLDVFPNIAVVTGNYDQIEEILMNIGVVDPDSGAPAFDIVAGTPSDGRQSDPHGGKSTVARSAALPPNTTFNFNTLIHDSALLAQYDIIFLNCGGKEDYASDPVALQNLKTYIENGGIVYATDWMFKYVRGMFDESDYLHFALPEKSGSSLSSNCEIQNSDLVTWLEGQGITVTASITVNGFLGSWQMVDNFNTTNVTSWLVADSVTYAGATLPGKSLAFTFQYGQGGVFYSSFHTHGNDAAEAAITQMMYYFIFELSGL